MSGSPSSANAFLQPWLHQPNRWAQVEGLANGWPLGVGKYGSRGDKVAIIGTSRLSLDKYSGAAVQHPSWGNGSVTWDDINERSGICIHLAATVLD